MRWPKWIPSRNLWLVLAILIFLPAAVIGLLQTYQTMSSLLWNYRTGTWLIVEAQSELQNTLLESKNFKVDPTQEQLDRLILRFDVFWSRIPLILESAEGQDVRRIPVVLRNAQEIADALPLLESELNLAVAGEAQTIQQFDARLASLMPLSEEMTRVLLVQDELRYQTGALARGVWVAAATLIISVIAGIALIIGNILKIRHVRHLFEQYKISNQARANQLMALESSGEGILMFDAKGCLEYSNEAFHKLIEDDFSRTLTRAHWESFLDESSIKKLQHNILGPNASGSWRGEVTGRTITDEERPWEIDVWPRKDGGYTCLIRDLSERKKVEQQRESVLERLHHIDKMDAVGRLAGGIAHDFNNILAAITGFGSLLEQDLEDRPPQQAMTRKLLAAANRGKDLVQSIMNYSRADKFERQSVDAASICREAASMAGIAMPANVTFMAEIGNHNLPILANSTQINRAVINLCINARDAVADKAGHVTLDVRSIYVDGGRSQGMRINPTISALDAPRVINILPSGQCSMRVGILTEVPGRYVRIRVTDTGCGMDELVLSKMFDPFYTTKGAGEGTGLGLSSVLGIVGAHGGAVSVDSIPGQGTVFDIFLPQRADGEITLPDTGQQSQSQRGIAPGLRVLLIDDDAEARAALNAILERLNCNPSECCSAEEALAVFADEPEMFDLVISDYIMPHTNGLQLATLLRQRGFRHPIILATGRLQDVPPVERARLGIQQVIQKPFDMADVAEAIQASQQGSELELTSVAPS